MNSILIIAGENSGEKYGAALVRKFKELQPSCRFFGIGGERMAQAGVSLLFTVSDMSLVGVFEILSKLKPIFTIFRKIKQEILMELPVAAVLIDSPDFNLRLAKFLKKNQVPVLYYVSPTIWAWRKNRLRIIKKHVDKMLLIFPFEEQIYMDQQIPASFIGHPLLETVKTDLTRTSFYQKYDLERHKRLICILPGSRRSEIDRHLPVLMETLELIRKKRSWQFLLLRAENIDQAWLQKHIPESLESIPILDDDRYEAMAYSDLVLAACGTATLEAALLETPAVTFYRISPLTYLLGKPFVKIRTYSIVNILYGKRVIPELIQNDFSAQRVFAEIERVLSSQEIQRKMKRQFSEIREMLSRGNLKASVNSAKELEKLIQQKRRTATTKP